ncbi:hypothetical protein D3C75_1019780 [compost metagenome]
MTQFSIREVDSSIDLRNPLELQTLEQTVEQVIQKQMQAMVDKAQSIKCDMFTFSEAMERADPAQWKKIRDRWGQIFPKVKVEYHVDAVIRNSQMRDRSFIYYKNSEQ